MDLKNSCHTFCLVTKSCPTLCDAVDCSMPGSPSSITGVCLNSCPLSQWCYLSVSSSAAPFFCLQSFPESGSFPMSWLFASAGQTIGASASASVLPANIQGWFPLGLTGLISLMPKGLSRVFCSTTVWKCQLLGAQPSLWSNSYPYMTTGKSIALTIQIFAGTMMTLLFDMLSRFVIIFLPRSKRLLILWLQSPTVVILEPPK